MSKVDLFRYDSEHLSQLVWEDLATVTPDQAAVWKQHPCTRALVHNLQAQITGTLEAWLLGTFETRADVDHAKGAAKACETWRVWIEGLPRLLEKPDDSGNTT